MLALPSSVGGTFVYLFFLCVLPIFIYLEQREFTLASSRQAFMCTVASDEGPGSSIGLATHPSPLMLC